MSQHDFDVENQSAAGVRQDMNNAIAALVSQNSGVDEPATTFPFMWWAASADDVLRIRNAADTAWIDILKISTGEPLQVNLTGAIRYKGNLDASLGQYPSNPEHGDTYRISVAGVLPTVGDVSVSDSIVYNGTAWDHFDHTDQVTSVAGLMGAISGTQLQTALGLGQLAYKNNGDVVKPNDDADLNSLKVNGTEVVDSSAKVDWSRLKNVPSFGNGTITGPSGRTTSYFGSGIFTRSQPNYVEVEQTGAKLRARNYYEKYNCNCDCTS